MAFTIFLVLCAAALAFMVRFLIALQKETSQVEVCRPVSVYRGSESGVPRESRASSSGSMYGDGAFSEKSVRWKIMLSSTGIANHRLSCSVAHK
jgi:hypothetical protein